MRTVILIALALLGGWTSARGAVPPSPATTATPAPPAVRKVTLDECLAVALGQNPQLLATMEAEQSARWRYYQSKAVYNPSVTVSSFRRRQTPPPSLGSFVFGARDVIDENAAINGTVYSFGRFENGVRARRNLSRAARVDTEDQRKAVRFQVTQAFYAVLLARALVAVAGFTVAQVQRQLDQTMRQFEAGTAARFDVVRARTQLANARPPLIRQQAAERVARQQLLTAMGVAEDLEIDPDGDFDTRAVPVTQQQALAMAYGTRSDLQALRARQRAAMDTVHEVDASDAPTLTYNVQTDDSLGQRPPFDKFVEINSATVAVNIPVWDGGVSHARTGEAKAEARRLRLLVQQLKNTIRLDIVQAMAQLDQARAVIAASGEALKEADEAVEIAEAGYEQGLRTNLEVLDAQLARDTARTNHAQARHDYAVARARLEQVVGGPIPEDEAAARAAATGLPLSSGNRPGKLAEPPRPR